ncbi:DUF202 domain-containing protein [Plantactinospora sp. KBS50]|uniref:DUF202 domain-containing protein n=1 Tax=Plantactinospora sp. KBS50 TaxID=2024580 RepID=UPI000BAABF78|nr:DUF202 domain-containing protein [Plantactinospora sp. KBS50]ASW53920.1 hypothetical protein CIK06_06590 [Plantactinospora sp. KBS50]
MTGDPGLQPERTRLSWRRTALAHAVVVLLLVRLALRHGPAGALPAVAAVAAVAGWALVVTVSYRRMAGDPRDRAPERVPAGGAALPVAAAVAAGYAVLGIVLLVR